MKLTPPFIMLLLIGVASAQVVGIYNESLNFSIPISSNQTLNMTIFNSASNNESANNSRIYQVVNPQVFNLSAYSPISHVSPDQGIIQPNQTQTIKITFSMPANSPIMTWKGRLTVIELGGAEVSGPPTGLPPGRLFLMPQRTNLTFRGKIIPVTYNIDIPSGDVEIYTNFSVSSLPSVNSTTTTSTAPTTSSFPTISIIPTTKLIPTTSLMSNITKNETSGIQGKTPTSSISASSNLILGVGIIVVILTGFYVLVLRKRKSTRRKK